MTTNRRPERASAAALLLVLLLAVLAGGVAPAQAGPVHPVQDGGSTTTTVAAPPDQDIIPEPNSGHDPEDAGDRGGALQLLVLGLIVAGIGLIATKVARDVRHNRKRTPTS